MRRVSGAGSIEIEKSKSRLLETQFFDFPGGVKARVLNASSIRPIDREALLAAASETGAIVTMEDHFVHGGLGGIVAEALAEERPTPIGFVGMRDRYGTSGTSDEVLKYFGLTPEAIAAAAREVITRKAL